MVSVTADRDKYFLRNGRALKVPNQMAYEVVSQRPSCRAQFTTPPAPNRWRVRSAERSPRSPPRQVRQSVAVTPGGAETTRFTPCLASLDNSHWRAPVRSACRKGG